ncbi:MAG: hypothetical protein H0T58_02715 [Gemmatimonadales bacterium]|nr:hypothetical protein [Gemmatimonadales bacterium]
MRSRTESRRPPWRPTVLVPLLLVLAACGGDELLLPSSGQAARIAAVGGNGQTGIVGQPLRDSLVVKVTDLEDRPVDNVEVTFVAPPGATLTPNDTVVTGPDGQAAVHYTLATASGEQTIEARATPVVPSLSLITTFSASAEPEAAVQLVAAGGNLQVGEVLTVLPESLSVTAVDRFGNGVAGIEVIWEVADGQVTPDTVVTGPDGRAAVQRALGARPGIYRTSAAAAALEGSPVLFEATGVPLPSPQLVLVTQASSSVAAGVPFERQPELQLQDAVGAPLARANVAVTVQIAEGGGSLGGTTTVRSNAEGRVSFTDLAIRGRPGERTLLFAASEFTAATSDVIEVNPGPPSASQSSASVGNGTAGTATTVSIRLKDQFGTELEGAAEEITVSVEGANSGDITVRELGGGSYSATYTPTVTGADQITVEVNGTELPSSPFVSQVAPGPASAATTTAQITRAGAFFIEINILVTTRDGEGNLLRRGGELVQIGIEGVEGVREARDNGDGTYSDAFVIVLTNPSLVITLNGQEISGSPYRP